MSQDDWDALFEEGTVIRFALDTHDDLTLHYWRFATFSVYQHLPRYITGAVYIRRSHCPDDGEKRVYRIMMN